MWCFVYWRDWWEANRWGGQCSDWHWKVRWFCIPEDLVKSRRYSSRKCALIHSTSIDVLFLYLPPFFLISLDSEETRKGTTWYVYKINTHDTFKKKHSVSRTLQECIQQELKVSAHFLLFFCTLWIKAWAFHDLPKTTTRTCTCIRFTAKLSMLYSNNDNDCQKESFSISMVASEHQKWTKYFSSWISFLHHRPTYMCTFNAFCIVEVATPSFKSLGYFPEGSFDEDVYWEVQKQPTFKLTCPVGKVWNRTLPELIRHWLWRAHGQLSPTQWCSCYHRRASGRIWFKSS